MDRSTKDGNALLFVLLLLFGDVATKELVRVVPKGKQSGNEGQQKIMVAVSL